MKKMVIILFVLLGSASCQSFEKNLAKDDFCSDQSVIRLSKVLDAWLAAIDQGRMKKFRSLSMISTIKYLDEKLGTDPDSDEEIDFVREITKNYSQYKNFDFLQCRCGRERVRLDYQKIDPDQTASFLSIMFHLEDGRWKVGSVFHAKDYPFYKDNQEPYGIDDFPLDWRFEIK